MAPEFEKMLKGTKEFPIGLFQNTSYIDKPHHHIEYEMLYLKEGKINVGIGKDIYIMEAGETVFIKPGLNHFISKIDNKDYRYYALVFDISVLGAKDDICRKYFESLNINLFVTLSKEIYKRIEKVTVLEEQKVYGREIVIKSLLFDVLSYLVSSKQFLELSDKNMPLDKRNSAAIEEAKNFVEKHYNENITLDDVLKLTKYSKSYFTKIFKESTNLTFIEYLNTYRVEKACVDLVYTEKTITQIALENGFNTTSYFAKIFKRIMNFTPKKYQKRGKSIIVPSTSVRFVHHAD